MSLQQYCESVKTSSFGTYKVYKSRLSFMAEFATKKYGMPVDNLILKLKGGEYDVYDFLSGYVAHLDKQGDSANSLRNKVITARNFLESNDVEISPRRFKLKVRLPKEERSYKEAIDKSDVRDILNSLENIRMKTYIMFLAATGCRAVEALSIRMKDVDFDANPARASIRAKYSKTRVGRTVYLTDELKNQLRQWVEFKYRKRRRVDYDRSEKGKRKALSRYYFTPKRSPEDLLFAYATEVDGINPTTMYANMCKTFDNSLDRNGFGAREPEGKRRKITMHSFRRFCKTAISNAGFEDFSEFYLGHNGSTYWRTKESERVAIFRKIEPYLTFLDVTSLEARGADQQTRIEQVQAENRSLKQDLQNLYRKLYDKGIISKET